MAFPDIGTFIIEDASFGDHVTFEPNHHCNIGTTGLLCMPQYILHRVNWRNIKSSTKRVAFQSYSDKRHDANRNYGGIFCLSPTDATKVMDGKEIEESFFPPGFVSSSICLILDLFHHACFFLGLTPPNKLQTSLLFVPTCFIPFMVSFSLWSL